MLVLEGGTFLPILYENTFLPELRAGGFFLLR